MQQTNTIEIILPECWSDLTEALRLYYLRARIQVGHRAAAIALATKILPQQMHAIAKYPHYVAEVISVFDYLQTPPDAPIVRSWMSGKVRYWMSDATMEHSSYMEYKLADHYYTEMVDAYTDKKLAEAYQNALYLTFTVCRPIDGTRKLKSDMRIPILDKAEIENTAHQVPRHIIECAVLFWEATATEMKRLYGKRVFTSSGEGGSSHGIHDFGLEGLAMQVAESSVYGDIKEVDQTCVHDILCYLTKKGDEQAIQQAATPSA